MIAYKCISLTPCLCRTVSDIYLTCVDVHTAAVGLDSELFASTVDASDDLISVGIGTSIQCDRDGQVGFDVAEIG